MHVTWRARVPTSRRARALGILRGMRVLCVGRHSFLSEHLSSWFRALGTETRAAVGLEEALRVAPAYRPEAVICDYDLLATLPIDALERDPLLSTVPVIAVSLTRRPMEVHLLDVNGIAGFLYLPSLAPGDARRLLGAVAARRSVGVPPRLPWYDSRPLPVR